METKSNILNFEYGIASEMELNQMLTEQDQRCFDEIGEILKKYQAKNRFGLTLLDTNLPNTIRLETNSVENRTLISEVIEKNQMTSEYVETNWNLKTETVVAGCSAYCQKGSGHNRQHQQGGEQQVGG